MENRKFRTAVYHRSPFEKIVR